MPIIGGELDAHRVAPKLYVGSAPPPRIAHFGFDLLVLCALEDQAKRDVPTLHVPLLDTEEKLDRNEIALAFLAASQIDTHRKQGARVLVTCQAGVNRSAFVAALALVRGGWTPRGAIERIRERRVPPVGLQPLCNRQFHNLIYVITGRTPPRARGRA